MEVIDALAKLSFSFWQVVVLIAMVIFRRELREMVHRITSLKVAGSEITWVQKSDTVATLTTLKSEVEKTERPDAEVIRLIDTKIHNRLVLALANLKRGTTYLWPELAKVAPGATASVPIRQETLDRLGSDIEALRGSGLIDFEIELGKDMQGIHKLLIRSVSEEFRLLVAEVQKSF